MKYIHILDEFSLAGGGVRSVVSDVSKTMVGKGVDVYIFTLTTPQDISVDEIKAWAKDNNIHFDLLGKGGGSLLKATLRLRHIIKKLCRNEECCLYMHLKKGVIMGILASLFFKKTKRVEVYHSGYMRYKLQAFLCKPFIHHYIAVSKDAKRQLVEQFGIIDEKITVAYNGVDLESIRSKAKDVRKEHVKVRFLTVGRLAYPKNIDLSVDAYSQLVSKTIKNNSEYLIAGDGPDREIVEKKANGSVAFLGLISRDLVCSHLASADVVVFPSLWEGNSIALLETIAVGTPLLVTDIPSFREVFGYKPLSEQELFRSEPFGAVFHKDSVESCMIAMEYMIKNKKQFQSMKSFVGALAEDYTLEKQCQKYLEVAEQ